MNVDKAIVQRHSTRAFLDKKVTTEQINHILSVASHSPSGANTQPWQVAVVSGDSKKRLQTKLEQAFTDELTPNPDYDYYPKTWKSPYNQRRKACGMQLYEAIGVDKRDIHARNAQWAANYRAFDAPVLLLFFIDKDMETGSFLDYGMFLQSIMLVAEQNGLATCPQAAFADYPDIIRQELNYSDEVKVLCGIALGYEDKTAPPNTYRTPREQLENFTRFFS